MINKYFEDNLQKTKRELDLLKELKNQLALIINIIETKVDENEYTSEEYDLIISFLKEKNRVYNYLQEVIPKKEELLKFILLQDQS